MLLQQQAILFQSGLPLEDALRMTIEQAETDKQRRMVESWRSEIVEGRSFSEALRRSPYKIPESLLPVLVLARRAGHLASSTDASCRGPGDQCGKPQNSYQSTDLSSHSNQHLNYCGSHYDGLGGAERLLRFLSAPTANCRLITRIVIASQRFYATLWDLPVGVDCGWGSDSSIRLMRDPVRKQRWHAIMFRICQGLGAGH